MFRIRSEFPVDGHRFGYFRMYEVPMVSLSSSIYKANRFEVSDEFSDLSWHSSEAPYQDFAVKLPNAPVQQRAAVRASAECQS